MFPSLFIDVSCSLVGFQSVWIKQYARVSAQVLCSLQMHIIRLSKSHTANSVVCMVTVCEFTCSDHLPVESRKKAQSRKISYLRNEGVTETDVFFSWVSTKLAYNTKWPLVTRALILQKPSLLSRPEKT